VEREGRSARRQAVDQQKERDATRGTSRGLHRPVTARGDFRGDLHDEFGRPRGAQAAVVRVPGVLRHDHEVGHIEPETPRHGDVPPLVNSPVLRGRRAEAAVHPVRDDVVADRGARCHGDEPFDDLHPATLGSGRPFSDPAEFVPFVVGPEIVAVVCVHEGIEHGERDR